MFNRKKGVKSFEKSYKWRFLRTAGGTYAEFYLDGTLIGRADKVGDEGSFGRKAFGKRKPSASPEAAARTMREDRLKELEKEKKAVTDLLSKLPK